MKDTDQPVDKMKARAQARQKKLSGAEAAGLMTNRPSDSNIGQIIRMLNNNDAKIREGALKSLTRIGGKEACRALENALPAAGDDFLGRTIRNAIKDAEKP